MGPSGPAREGSGILRVRKPPFAETELGAKHCPILSSFLVPRRSWARSFCFLEGKPPLSYGAWVGSSDRVLQSISSPTTCFMRTLRTREELWFIQSHTASLWQNVYLFMPPRLLEGDSLCKVLLGFSLPLSGHRVASDKWGVGSFLPQPPLSL